MKKLIQERKGFTLIELMVVVAIMATLAAMVLGGVTGTGTSAEKGQVMNDASSLKTSVTSFNNSAIDQSWPVVAITVSGNDYVFASEGFNFLNTSDQGPRTIQATKLASIGLTATSAATSGVTNYELINWKAATKVRQKQGDVALAKLVPDFLDAPPDSTRLLSDTDAASGGKLPEYLWLLKIGSSLDADARSVQVWHLDDKEGLSDSDRLYIRIYPKVQ